ncbi:carboxypeptidase-like regulatory domain-containing protein [Mucilaginibacter sp. BJC16-A38]|uniref:carboxypeptidase-like regulatory domain-containing protein n=1 Tax=Mucilaginibacter phenanthrenivorans TaxID=1234842 RepID=UPI0021579CA6|nr:carboxypeptidase-like regulatory domain-containing protein [Mucilaginibacter phenanthrenivorans]MCR8557110.1 carboxypeptidase-like regulatory domain-containing protein [Mucilaginibacter phenanthrenivorans]
MIRIRKITIPERCNQQWAQMTTADNGRHCEQCCKTVVDFAAMTDAQLISYLVSHNNVCGRLSGPQLSRVNLQLNGQDAKPKTGWKKWVITTVLLGSTVFYKVHGQTAPGTPKSEQSIPESYPASVNIGKGVAHKGSERIITGRIVDDACMPLRGATVKVVGTNIVLPSDTNGRFKFHAPIAAKLLTVSFVGFETETIDIDSIQNGVHEVKLTPQVLSMNGVVVVPGYYAQRRTELVGAISVVITKKHCWLWRMYYKYIRTPIHNIFY